MTTDVRAAVPGEAGVHEWRRAIWAWHVVFAGLASVTAILLLVDGGAGPGQRFVALALLTAVSGWYLATGTRALHREPGRLALVYLAGAASLTLALFAAAPAGAVMLFVLYPHLWVLLPLRWAVASTVAMVGLVAAVAMRHQAVAADPLAGVFVPTAVALLVGTGLGVWITRIIAQSKRRADLIAQLTATRAELAGISRQAGRLAERQRLAQEIHDTLAQGFTSVLRLLDAVESALDRDRPAVHRFLHLARQTARDNLREARIAVDELSPPPLPDAPLADAVRQLAHRVLAATGIEVAVTVTGAPRWLTAQQELALLRVSQEALANIHRHAAAKRVDIALGYHDAGVTLQVADDGQGFDPACQVAGFGLTGIRERAAYAGGTAAVRSAPGAGTTVRVELGA